MAWLAVTAGVLLGVAFLLVRARWWPIGPCPRCKRRKRRGRGLGSTDGAYNRCRKCGGRSERIRPISRIYPRWNEEAKKR